MQRKALAILSLAVSACATPPAKDFVEAELGGKINGREWSYKHAYIDPTIDTPEDEDLVFVFLSYKPKAACPTDDEVKADTRSVMVSAPKLKKLTKLKSQDGRSLVFHFEKKGQQFVTVAKDAKIKITVIGDKAVRGKVFGKFNDANWVSGNFSAVLCDYREMQQSGWDR